MQLHPLFYWRRKSSAVRRRYEQPGRHDFMIFLPGADKKP